MDNLQEFTQWAVASGVALNGVRIHKFPGKGLGLVAERNIAAGEVLLTVPKSAFRTARTASKKVTQHIETVSVNGLLAAELALETSMVSSSWLAVLPTSQDFHESMPIMWPSALQTLLPAASLSLLQNQKKKISDDWTVVCKAFPAISYDRYLYMWLLVSTRTFYYTSPHIKARRTLKSDDCLALVPFADFFNHADDGCELIFLPTKYEFRAVSPVAMGEEIFTSYGGHSNDFLLVEYGFILTENKWDVIPLDDVVLALFSKKQKQELKRESICSGFTLDKNGVCYRTQIALALLCLPVDAWHRLRTNGLACNDELQTAIHKLLYQILTKLLEVVDEKSQQVTIAECGLSSQIDTLRRRWEQIRCLVTNAIDSIET